MEKIEILLDQLDNRITSSLAKRLDKLEDLHEKLELSGLDYERNPSNENREKYNEIIEYVDGIEQGIVKDLQVLLARRKEEEFAKKQQASQPAPAPTSTTSSVNTTEKKEEKEEKKEGGGVLTFVIGSALLIASFGAINYFRKR